MKKSQLRQAITLTEIVAVVSLLGVIASVVLPRIFRPAQFHSESDELFQRNSGNDSDSAIELYYADHDRRWTESLDDLVPDYTRHGLRPKKDGSRWRHGGPDSRAAQHVN